MGREELPRPGIGTVIDRPSYLTGGQLNWGSVQAVDPSSAAVSHTAGRSGVACWRRPIHRAFQAGMSGRGQVRSSCVPGMCMRGPREHRRFGRRATVRRRPLSPVRCDGERDGSSTPVRSLSSRRTARAPVSAIPSKCADAHVPAVNRAARTLRTRLGEGRSSVISTPRPDEPHDGPDEKWQLLEPLLPSKIVQAALVLTDSTTATASDLGEITAAHDRGPPVQSSAAPDPV